MAQVTVTTPPALLEHVSVRSNRNLVSARPRESGDPGQDTKDSQQAALDSRFRENERKWIWISSNGTCSSFAAKLPEGIPRLQEQLSFMREPIDALAIAKIICDRVRPLAAFGHFLEG